MAVLALNTGPPNEKTSFCNVVFTNFRYFRLSELVNL